MKHLRLLLILLFLTAPLICTAQDGSSASGGPVSAAQYYNDLEHDDGENEAAKESAPDDPSLAVIKGPAPKAKLAKAFSVTFNVPLPAGAKAEDLQYDKETFNNRDFEVLSASSFQTGESAEYTFELLPFAIGKTPFKVEWTLPSYSGKIKSKEVTIDIGEVPTGFKNNVLQDIRPPYKPFNLWLWVKVLIVVLVIGILVFLFLNRKDKNIGYSYGTPTGAFKDRRTIDEIARERIAQAIHSGLWEKAQYNQLYTELTDVLRWYLHKRYNIDTQVQTTYELVRAIRDSKAREVLDAVKDFLNSADLVKFAQHTPLILERDEDIKLLEKILVTSTRSAREEALAQQQKDKGGGK
ncbi:hypothetical protein Dip510_001359 [Elusimicrobium posterum]|uniref:hypothetical protein n=1 Tax=Elusimicrobium posterum TaxID=3116653 RepID=UPI003C71458A